MITDISEIMIFSEIPHKDLPEILSVLKERDFKKNHILMFENDQSDEIFILRSGKVKVYRVHDEKEIIISIGTTGDILGEIEALSDRHERISSVEVLENTSTWLISKKDFLQLVDKYPSILRRAYLILAERLRMINRLVRYLSFYDVRTKVANLLIDLYFNFGTHDENVYKIDLKINQSTLANMLGVTRESISKTISDFQKEGLIDIVHKTFYILDKEKLELICVDTEEVPELRKWYDL